MTVGQLKVLLADVPDDLDVTVRASDDENGCWVVGGIWHVGIDTAHDDDCTPFLAIEVTTDEDEVAAYAESVTR